MTLEVPGLYDGCDDNSPLKPNGSVACNDQNAPYTVGYASQFGNNRSIALSPWAGVSGMANIGWYWRTPWGAPSTMNIGNNIQLARGFFVVLAMRYPAQSKFTVTFESNWWGSGLYPNPLPMAPNLAYVTKTTEDIPAPSQMNCTSKNWYDFCHFNGTGYGPSWFFDGQFLYVRVVNFNCYNINQYQTCSSDYYGFQGMELWDVENGFTLNINASCAGCTVAKSYSGVEYYEVADEVPNWEWPVMEAYVAPTPTTSSATFSQPSGGSTFFTPTGVPTVPEEKSSSISLFGSCILMIVKIGRAHV